MTGFVLSAVIVGVWLGADMIFLMFAAIRNNDADGDCRCGCCEDVYDQELDDADWIAWEHEVSA